MVIAVNVPKNILMNGENLMKLTPSSGVLLGIFPIINMITIIT